MEERRYELVLATTNPGKLAEIRSLLADLPLQLSPVAQYRGVEAVEEDADTYAGNALLKAVAAARACRRPALADDSGLEVDALGGAPGVHSARYAGAEQDAQRNLRRLLGALDGVPEGARRGRFRCVVVVACPHGATISADGVCEGTIAGAPRGDHGFGYDPVFFLPEHGCTMAELAPEVKNRISHRARALMALRKALSSFMREPCPECRAGAAGLRG
jgi:XTP/dITP diphosphohydrolase